MDRLENYRDQVQELIRQYADYAVINKGVERQVIFDHENDHYLLFSTGWNGNERIHGSTIHIDIKDGKIWIQDNRTEVDIAQELIRKGVSKDDIVLGLQSPYMRQFTEFAVG